MSDRHAAIQPLYAIVGQDRFLRQEAMKIVLRAIEGEDDSLGPTRIEGGQADLAEVLDEVRTVSLLPGRRTVIVDDADAFITAHRKALEGYCAAPCDSGTLILACNSLPKNTKLYKAIAKGGQVIHREPLKGAQAVSWAMDRARSIYGKRMASHAAALLREHVGNDPGGLDAELGKLSTYVGVREEITRDDIEALVGLHREEKVFAVTDAMAAGDTEKALLYWEQVLATDRAAPGRAVAGLAFGARRLLEARKDWEGGVSVQALARRMFTDPHVLERRLKNTGIDELENRMRDLCKADLAVKTGAGTLERAVEKFIVTHTAPKVAVGAVR